MHFSGIQKHIRRLCIGYKSSALIISNYVNTLKSVETFNIVIFVPNILSCNRKTEYKLVYYQSNCPYVTVVTDLSNSKRRKGRPLIQHNKYRANNRYTTIRWSVLTAVRAEAVLKPYTRDGPSNITCLHNDYYGEVKIYSTAITRRYCRLKVNFFFFRSFGEHYTSNQSPRRGQI